MKLAPLPRPRIVLDTNVVLDWMVFDDPRCRLLVTQIERAQLQWIATAAMRDELARVLTRPNLQRWQPHVDAVLARFDLLAQRWTPAPSHAAVPRCADADDQVFIDLACQAGARWLCSRDRALLELAVPARRHGVQVITPEHWNAAPAWQAAPTS